MKKTWFLTGASRGLGRVWLEAALSRGDQVAAIARSAEPFAPLVERFGSAILPIAADVADATRIEAAMQQAHQHFGQLDVVLNNAGYPLVGAIEEVSDEEVRAQFETNILGTLRVIRAAMPILRKQGSGHILGVSSTLGQVAFPLIGMYAASKHAFEAMHEALAQEVKPFGVRVSIIEPGAYATDFGGPQSGKLSEAQEPYAPLREAVFANLRSMKKGVPEATAEAVLALVDSNDPPLRMMLGDENLPLVRAAYASRLAEWDAWAEISNAAQGN